MAVGTKLRQRIRLEMLGTVHTGGLVFHLIVDNKVYCIVKKNLKVKLSLCLTD
jgi:hypothetical protein